jgi:hypothetical protein
VRPLCIVMTLGACGITLPYRTRFQVGRHNPPRGSCALFAPPTLGEGGHRGLARRLIAVRCAFDVTVVATRPHTGTALRPDCIEEEDTAHDDAVLQAASDFA